jgi:hypothetical protein
MQLKVIVAFFLLGAIKETSTILDQLNTSDKTAQSS